MNKKEKLEWNPKLLIVLIIIVILCIILNIVNNNKSKEYETYKQDTSKNYVYTKYHSDTNKASIPYINVSGEDVSKVNNEIINEATPYLTSSDPNKTVTYRYNQNKNILSVVLTYRDIDSNDQLTYLYKTYVFDLKNNAHLLSDEEILKKFNITYAEVNEIMATKMKEKYQDEVSKGYIEKNECDYKCYLNLRNITNYIDNANYYIENSRLVVYKVFEVYSIYGEEDYFTRNDFKFIIK